MSSHDSPREQGDRCDVAVGETDPSFEGLHHLDITPAACKTEQERHGKRESI